MTIAEVLIQAGHPLGKRGRTTCPLHGGGNVQSFKYRELGFVCFACGESGNVHRLRDRLLGKPEPRRAAPVKPLAGVSSTFFVPDVSRTPRLPTLLARLERLVRRRAEDRALLASYQHEDAIALLDNAAALFTLSEVPSARADDRCDLALDFVAYGWQQLVAADAVLGCACHRVWMAA